MPVKDGREAAREADRAEARAWSLRKGYGGPAQPFTAYRAMPQRRTRLARSRMQRCKTRASLPLDAIRRPRDTPLWMSTTTRPLRAARR